MQIKYGHDVKFEKERYEDKVTKNCNVVIYNVQIEVESHEEKS
jgi:hypothetical protein